MSAFAFKAFPRQVTLPAPFFRSTPRQLRHQLSHLGAGWALLWRSRRRDPTRSYPGNTSHLEDRGAPTLVPVRIGDVGLTGPARPRPRTAGRMGRRGRGRCVECEVGPATSG